LDEAKKAAGNHAASLVKDGMTIGIGSGTTVYWFIRELGNRIDQGLHITGVPTSTQTEKLAAESGIRLTGLNEVDHLQLTVDGADEIDGEGNLIKGGGGALLQEKMVAAASRELIIIADKSKVVPRLGKFPLPVEVIPFGYKHVQQKIIDSGLCKQVRLRSRDNKIFITDHHHYVLDCEFDSIADSYGLNIGLHLIPGVVETGLFVEMASSAVIGFDDGTIQMIRYK